MGERSLWGLGFAAKMWVDLFQFPNGCELGKTNTCGTVRLGVAAGVRTMNSSGSALSLPFFMSTMLVFYLVLLQLFVAVTLDAVCAVSKDKQERKRKDSRC